MPTTFANTISLDGGVTNLPIYADRAEKDASGNDISTTYATKSELPASGELVPAATSADEDKVLTVDAQGIPGWAIVPSGSTGLFEAIYGQTTYAAITQAISEKKIVYCRISATGASRMAFLAYIGTSNVEFQYYRSLNTHSASAMTDEVYVYTVASSGWTTTTRKTGAKVVAGTHMSQSYSNDTLTLNCTWPTVDQTYDASSADAQSGVAIAGALADKEDAFNVGAGLELDTSGTTPVLQVDETVLWENATGAAPSDFPVTLSETTSNFERIRFYFRPWSSNSCVVEKMGDQTIFMLESFWVGGTASSVPYSFLDILTATGTQLSFTRGTFNMWSQNTLTEDTAQFRLFKVVGVKRIASN